MSGKSETVSENVIHSVAARANADPLDLPPLYNSMDPEALEAGIKAISDGKIQFEYAGYSVTVYSDETITVSEVPTGAAKKVERALDD